MCFLMLLGIISKHSSQTPKLVPKGSRCSIGHSHFVINKLNHRSEQGIFASASTACWHAFKQNLLMIIQHPFDVL